MTNNTNITNSTINAKFEAINAMIADNVDRRNQAQADAFMRSKTVVERLVGYINDVKRVITTIHNVYNNIDTERFPDRLPIAAMAAIPEIASFDGSDMYVRTGNITITFAVPGHDRTLKLVRSDDYEHPVKLWNLLKGYSEDVRNISEEEAQWMTQLADAMPKYISDVYDTLSAMVEDYV